MGLTERGIIKKIVNDENPFIQNNMKVIKLPFACSEFSVHEQNQRQTDSKFGFLHNVPFSFARVLKFTVPR